MIKLDVGNVLLKPSHRKQLMGWLKRPLRMGDRLGDSVISISMHRTGRSVEIKADVANRRGSAGFRSRKNDWHYAARDVVQMLAHYLHDLSLQPTIA